MKKYFILSAIVLLNLTTSLFSQEDIGISPKNNTVFGDTVIQFVWNNLGDNFVYNLKISENSLFSSILIDINTTQVSETISELNHNQNYYWKITSTSLDTTIISLSYAFTISDIASLSSICLWKDPTYGVDTTADGNVSFWRNRIQNSDSAFQITASKQPKYILTDSLINNQPSISFDGTDDQLINTNYHKLGAMYVVSRWNGPETLFPAYNGMVAKYSSADFPYVFVGYLNKSILYSSGIPWAAGDIYVNQQQTLEYSPLHQYKMIYGETSSPANFNDLLLGSAKTSSWYWKGEITEIIAFDTIPSDSVKNIVNGYLQNKYAPSVNLGQDITAYGFCDTSLTAGYKPWFTSYSWSNGSSDSIIHVSKNGQYVVTVTDIFGNTSSDSINVVFPTLNQITDTSLCLGDSILWDTDLQGDYSYEWVGSTKTDTAIYLSASGDYAFIVTDTNGCKFYSDTIKVMVDSFPVQNSLGVDRSVCQGEAVTLIANSGDIVSWLWSQGGTTAYININTAGEYAVTVNNAKGCEAIDTAYYSLSGLSPTVYFAADSVCFSDSTTFTNLSSIVGPDFIASYIWDFGNDSISFLESPKHLYQLPDTFIVTLTAIANTDCSNLYSDSIIVKNKPYTGFEVLYGDTHCTSIDVQFLDTSNSGISISDYLWDFGDTNTSSLQNPSKQYSVANNYSVSLKTTAINGCEDSTSSILSIVDSYPTPTPPAIIEPDDNYFISKSTAINFEWEITGNAILYTFELANDSIFSSIIYSEIKTTANTSSYTLPNQGKYFWRVIAYNVCQDSIITDIRSIQFSAIDSLPGINLWLSASDGVTAGVDSNVLYWQNLINTADSAFQITASKQPKYILTDSLINNQPSISFDGTDDQLINTNYHKLGAMYVVSRWNGPETLFPAYNGMVAKYSSADFPYVFVGYLNKSILYSSGIPWAAGDIYVNQQQTLEYSPLHQYKMIYGETSSPANFNDLLLGSAKTSSWYWKGEITEIIAFDTIPSDSVKNIVNGYLQNKYTPSVNLGQDITAYGFCDTSLTAGYKPWFTSYSWSNGSSDSIIHVSKNGQYVVTVTDIFGNTSSDSINVVFPTLNQITDTSLCLGDSILWDTDLQGDYSYEWVGSTKTDTAIYLSASGDYAFIVTDTNGCKFYSDTIKVMVDSFPVQNSLGVDRSVCQGEAVTLIANSGDIVSWLWSQGGTTAYININTAGEYAVTVNNAKGCEAIDTAYYSLSGLSPTVYFAADSVCFSDSTTFTNLSSIVGPDFIASYIWDFGNDSISFLESPKHLYQLPDTFIVTLTAIANTDCSNLYSDSIIVKNKPYTGFEVLYGDTHCTSIDVQFLDTSNSGISISDYLWDFGDTNTSSLQNPSKQYSVANNYSVSLKTTAINGCEDSTSSILSIVDSYPTPTPPAIIEPDDNYFISKSTAINFEWEITGNAILYTFELANDSIFSSIIYSEIKTTANTSSYTLPNQGKYFWRVIAYNVCQDSIITDIRSIQFSAIDSLPGINLWLSASDGVTAGVDSNVLYWQNLINTADSAFQITASKQPKYILTDSLINNQPSISFDGTDDQLINTNYHKLGAMYVVSRWNGPETLFPAYNGMVAKYSSADFPYVFVGDQNKSSLYSSGIPWAAGDIYVNQQQTLEYSPLHQYKMIYGETSSPANFNDLLLGSAKTSSWYWKGEITEIIAFDTIPSDSVKNIVNGYLQNKYAPSVNLGQDITAYGFCDTSLTAGYKPWFTSYSWSNGSSDSIIHVSKNGQYVVTVTDIFGNTSSDSINVVFPTLNQITDTSLCLGDSILWDTDLQGDYSYEWVGSTKTDTAIYLSASGDYAFIVTDTNGCKFYSDTIKVMVDSFPVQNSLGVDRSVCQGEAVTLIANSGDIVSWLWSQGGTTAYININTAGEYAVTVNNAKGCEAIDTAYYSLSGLSPTVYFAADSVCFSDSTTFTNLSSIVGPDFIASYIWDFGNDSISFLESPKHLYQLPDTFIVTLTAIANTDCSNLYSDSIIVKNKPYTGFEVLYGDTHCTSIDVQFLDTSNSGISISDYLWDFGDTNTSSLQNPSKQYSVANNYSVSLKTTAINGCEDSTSSILSIVDSYPTPTPPAIIEPDDNYFISKSTAINFEWEITGNAILYTFELANDSIFSSIIYSEIKTTANTSSYTLPNQGKYFWRVIAYNVCQDSIITDIRSIQFSAIDSLPGINLWLSASDGVTAGVDSNVLYWQNLINTADSAFQITASKQPKYILTDSLINNQPSISFDGTDDQLINTNYHKLGAMYVVSRWNGPETLFPAYNGMVAKYSSADFPYVFVGDQNKSSLYSSGIPWAAGDIYVNQQQTLEYSPLHQYKMIYGETSSPANFNDLLLGSAKTSSWYWKGEITEIIAFDTIPSDSVKNIVNGYLQNKYSPPVNLGEDVNLNGFCDTSISAHKPWFTSYKWSYQGDSISTDSAITVSQPGTYLVSVTDIFGFTSSDSIKVTFPQPGNISDTTICLYDTVHWNPGLKGDYTYEWSSGEITPQLAITVTGDYWLIMRDNQNNPWYSDTITVMVDEFPARVSLGNDTTLCQGNRVYLQEGYDEAESYLWSSGDQSDYIVLETAGTYGVTATNALGCVGIDSISLEVNGIAPTPDFTFDNRCDGDLTLFSDNSSSPDGSQIISWSWDFGDGESAEGMDNEHKYPNAGLYNAVLTIGNENACNNSIRKEVQIYHRPTANFGPTVSCSNVLTNLIDASTAADGEVAAWVWTLPDASLSEDKNPEYIFTEAGANSIQLIAQSTLGCRDTAIQNIEVKPGPFVDFTFSPGCEGYPVYFTDASESFLNSALAYTWTFEPGNTNTQNNPSYAFPATGSYSVKLEVVQHINNCYNSIEKEVVINQNPEAQFTKDVFCEQYPAKLTDASTSPDASLSKWTWEVASLGKYSGSQITIKFDSAGRYNTILTIEDANGCEDKYSDSIEVNALPRPHFLTNVTKGAVPLVVDFDNRTTGAESYSWNFGDGASSVDAYPTHTYTDSGVFEIELFATSNMGCTESSKASVKAIVPMIDIAVMEVSAEINNGYMQVNAVLQNLGSIDLENVALFYKANYGQTIKEVLQESFLSGQTRLHTFITQMEVKSDAELTHVCVKALPDGYTDEVLENNEKCLAFENAFKPMHPYPNPAKDELIVEYIIPFDADVKVLLFNQYGKLTHRLFEGKASAGFNRHIFDVRSLSKGVYIYRIEFEGNMVSFQVIIQ